MKTVVHGLSTEDIIASDASTKYSFSDLVDISELKEMLEHFSEIVGCDCSIIDVNNNVLLERDGQKICTEFHRVNSETLLNCILNECSFQENLKAEKPVHHKCKNGLNEVVLPIFIEGKHLANLVFGHFLFDDEKIDFSFFEKQAIQYGFDTEAYLQCVREVPLFSRAKLETLKNLGQSFAKITAKMAHANLLGVKKKIVELGIANKQIADAETRFRRLFDQAGVGVVHVDANTGGFLKINKKFLELIGYNEEELLQMKFLDLTHPDDLEESKIQIQKLTEKKLTEFSQEKRYIKKDGTILWAIVTVSSLVDTDGRKKNSLAIVQDITEQKLNQFELNRNELDLNESELKFSKLFENVGVGVGIVDGNSGQFLKVNSKYAEMLGYTTQEMESFTFKDITHPDDVGKNVENLILLSKNKIREYITEKRYIRKDGTILWVMLTVSPMNNVLHGAEYHITVVQDITERKMAELKLIESETRFRKLFELSGVGVSQVDVESGKFIKVNRKFADMLGYSISELMQLTFRDITYVDDLVLSENNQAKIIKKQIGEFSVEKRYLRKDGSFFWGLLTASAMDESVEGKKYQIAIVQDINERKEAELKLVESETKFKNTFKQSLIGLEIYDGKGKLLDCNPSCLSMFGVASIDEVIGFNLFDDPNLSDLQKNKIREGEDVFFELQFDFELVKKWKLYNTSNSGIRYFSCLATSIKLEGEDEKGYLIHLMDITERKRVEDVLKNDNQRFHTTMDAMDSVIYVADMEMHEILFVNKFGRKIFGEVIGKKCYSALQGKTAPCEFCTNHLLLNAEGFANEPYVWEFQNPITKGWYQCHDQSIKWTDGRMVRFEMAVNITKSKEIALALEENDLQLRELNSTKDKFFSIISHDLKNPFAVLKSSSELLSRYLEKNDLEKSKAKAEMISNASNRGYVLLENLLIWAQSQTGAIKFSPRTIILNHTVSESISDVQDQAKGKSILIKNEIPDDLIIDADENLLAIVFRNLLTNAIKFTHKGGTITVTSKTDDGKVEVAVIDTGIGIPKSHQYKLFRLDDNFSRPGTDNEASTSLGLILCKEFIEKHKGRIWVESEENRGSEFRFVLPLKN